MAHSIRAKITKDTSKKMPEGICVDRFAPVNDNAYVLDYFTCNFYEQVVETGENNSHQVRACKSLDNKHHWIETESSELHTMIVEVIQGDVNTVKDFITKAINEVDRCINWLVVDTDNQALQVKPNDLLGFPSVDS